MRTSVFIVDARLPTSLIIKYLRWEGEGVDGVRGRRPVAAIRLRFITLTSTPPFHPSCAPQQYNLK